MVDFLLASSASFAAARSAIFIAISGRRD